MTVGSEDPTPTVRPEGLTSCSLFAAPLLCVYLCAETRQLNQPDGVATRLIDCLSGGSAETGQSPIPFGRKVDERWDACRYAAGASASRFTAVSAISVSFLSVSFSSSRVSRSIFAMFPCPSSSAKLMALP